VPPAGVRFFLVLFQDTQPAATAVAAVPAVPPSAAQQHVIQLQQELTALREYVQSVTEERDSTNEELWSANEEILSANEELQSTNEELQAAKEEAQSANEELATVNEELRRRNAELARTNEDLVNILSGANIPIIMVTRDLRIRRFTPIAEKVFNLIPTDVGRPISDIKSKLTVADLGQLITGVIETLQPHDAVVMDYEHRTYCLRIRPYLTEDKRIDGASVVLLDLDEIKHSLEAKGAEEKHVSGLLGVR
jgi:two-component system CheB/CheR fusion protein